jgi:DNA-directed RNA polymerase subunit L
MADSLGMESAEAKAMKDLQEANKSMMDWMQEFGDKFDSEEILDGKELSKEKVQLLNEEEQKIEAVKEAINSSISRAEELLKN